MTNVNKNIRKETRKPTDSAETQSKEPKKTPDSKESSFLKIKSASIIEKILNFIVKIILVIFYPIIWILREIYRIQKFLRNKEHKNTDPLTNDEILVVESLPFFLILLGITLPLMIIAYTLGNLDQSILDFTGTLTSGISGVQTLTIAFFTFFYEVILQISEFVFNSFAILSKDTTVILIVLMVIAFIIGLGYLFLTETGLLQKFIYSLAVFVLKLLDLPGKIYHSLDFLWIRLLKSIGAAVTGNSLLNSNSRAFYQRLVALTLVYTIITNIWGLSLLVNDLAIPGTGTLISLHDPANNTHVFYATIFLFYLNLLIAVLAGFLLLTLLVRILHKMSKQKYQIDESLLKDWRHKELINFITKKKKNYTVINLAYVALANNLPLNEIRNRFTDKQLQQWKIYSSYLVNQAIFDKYMKQIEKLHKEGIDSKRMDPLVKCLDYIGYIRKKFIYVDELQHQIKTKYLTVAKDLAEMRGEDFKMEEN